MAVRWGKETLSLQLFPGLTAAEQDYVIEIVKNLYIRGPVPLREGGQSERSIEQFSTG